VIARTKAFVCSSRYPAFTYPPSRHSEPLFPPHPIFHVSPLPASRHLTLTVSQSSQSSRTTHSTLPPTRPILGRHPSIMSAHYISAMEQKPLKTELKDDMIIVNDDLKISFRRTIRVPDNQQVSFLPPDLGAFPLKSVRRYEGRIGAEMSAKGGVFFPMWQSEAMWIDFKASGERDYMVKVCMSYPHLRITVLIKLGLRRPSQRHLGRTCVGRCGYNAPASDKAGTAVQQWINYIPSTRLHCGSWPAMA
jgi:hypothetical protein